MTRDEFEALLEEAFLCGYNDAIDEIFEEDNTFDLEDEMDTYNEENKAPLALDPNLFKNGKATTVIDKYNKTHKIYENILKNKIKEKIKKGNVMNISDLDKLLDKYGEKHESFFNLEDEMDSYDEAWKPSEFKSVKHAQDMIDAGHSGISKQTLGKNKADFFRKRIIPRIGKGLSQGKTFGDMIGEINKEKQMADTYYKPGHAVDQTNNYAHRVARYIAAKQNAKNNK